MNITFLRREAFMLLLSILTLNIFSQTFTDVTPPVIQPDQLGQWDNSCIVWIDIDKDNDLDLLLQNKLYRNLYPTIGFESKTLPFTIYKEVALGDYDNDGLIDVAIPSGGLFALLYKNIGDCSFDPPQFNVLNGNSLGPMEWGDYDNDGDLDLIMRSQILRNNGNGSFTLMESIVMQETWNGMTRWNDYNNDGLLDVIFTGQTADEKATSFYKNNGNNAFSKINTISINGLQNGSFDWGDYDNDGDHDLLVSGLSESGLNSAIYRNDGEGMLTKLIIPDLPGLWLGEAKWGDYDADGDLDILAAGHANQFDSNAPFTGIFRNDGNDSFSLQNYNLEPLGSGSVAWGDYDKDGDLDIALISIKPNQSGVYETIARVYRNDLGVTNPAPAAPSFIHADVNNLYVTLRWDDVKTDNTPGSSITYNLKIENSDNGNVVMQSNSHGNGFRKIVSFGNAWQGTNATFKLPFGNYTSNVQAVDNGFTGGPFCAVPATFSIVPVQARSLSAIIINSTTLKLKWNRGTGDRCVVFCKQTSSETAAPEDTKTYAADAEYGLGYQIGTTGWYCVYNGRSDSVVVSGLIVGKQYSFHVFEYSGTTGTEDYLDLSVDGNPGVFSTSMFTEQTAITNQMSNLINSRAIWGDYNDNGFLDVFVQGDPSKIYKNMGDNTFDDIGISFPSIENGSSAWGDYDNDGDLDLLITGRSTSPITKLFENKGNDVFEELLPNVFTPVCWSSVAWGDYDADGDLDLLINGSTGNTENSAPVTKVYKNNGSGTFAEQTTIVLTGLNKGSVKWADYDNDGDLDIFNTGSTSENIHKTEIYRNNGTGTFVRQDQAFAEQDKWLLDLLEYSALSPGDYDNDGDLDLLISFISGAVVFENKGDGTFEQFLRIPISANTLYTPCSAEWIDFNNDGFLDFIMTNPGWFTRIYRNTKGVAEEGSFSNWFVLHDGTLKKIANYYANIGDYDNDGDQDILLSMDFRYDISGSTGMDDKFSILANNFSMKSGVFHPNQKSMKPSNTISTNTPTGVILSWDPPFGDETIPEAMTYNVQVGTTENSWNICPPNFSIPALGNAQTGTTFQLKNLPSGIYHWRVQAVDQAYGGSWWSPSKIFEVKNVQAFFSSDEVCLGLPSHFTDQSVATKGIASWLWDFGDGTTSSIQNPQHTYATSGTFSVKLTITDTEGATDFLIQSATVKAKPSTSFNAPAVCQGIAAIITNTTNKNGLTISSWFWDFGDGQTSIVEQPAAHGYLGASEYTVVLKALSSNGCLDTIAKKVIVGAYPVAAVTANAPLTFCKGDSVTLTVPYNADYLYTWNSDGTSITGADSSRYVAKLTGSIVAEVTNSKGNCKTTSSAVSIVAQNAPASPLITFSGNLTFCQGDSIVLSVTNTSVYSYQWKLNGGAVGKNSNQFIAKSSGNYTLVVSNSNGCSVSSTNSVDVTVNPLPVVSDINLVGVEKFCSGGKATLSLPANSEYTYSWKRGTNDLQSTGNSIDATESGEYSVVVSLAGCKVTTAPRKIEVVNKPAKPDINPGTYKKDDCLGDIPPELSVDNVVSGYTYQWYKNETPISSATSIEVTESGNYYLEAVVDICPSERTLAEIIFKKTLPEPVVIAKGPTVWILSTGSKAEQYKWFYNGNQIPDADNNVYVAGQNMGTYRVAISNDGECFSFSDYKTIPDVVGIEDPDPFKDVRIYPNPTTGMFTIEMNNNVFGELVIDIITQNGSKILNIKFDKSTDHFSAQIDLSGQSNGMYLINLSLDKFKAVRKILVE